MKKVESHWRGVVFCDVSYQHLFDVLKVLLYIISQQIWHNAESRKKNFNLLSVKGKKVLIFL